jgi:periplasmic divalent cation tolerance protein
MVSEGGPAAAEPAAAGQYLQVQTTTDSRAEAIALGRAAVEERLAACAQVAGPIASTYWWEGGIERAEEWLVLLKLPADRFAELSAFITERHSYDEPEIVALPITAGSPGYLGWIREETTARLSSWATRWRSAGTTRCCARPRWRPPRGPATSSAWPGRRAPARAR